MLERCLYPFLVGAFMLTVWCLLGVVPLAYQDLIPGLLSLPTLVLMERLERRRPHRLEWRKSYGDGRSDLIHTIILFPLVLKLAQLGASTLALRSIYLPTLSSFDEQTSIWIQFFIVLLLAELCFYCFHRLAHEIPLLWRFHRIHHGAARVYWANAARFHPVDLWMTMTFYFLPFYLIVVPHEVIVLFLSANVITGVLEHANIRFEAGPLNYLFNTAQLHRWHHSRKMSEANSNFGKVLCVWDLAFNSWRLDPGSEVGEVGLSDGEAPVPETIWRQGMAPFLTGENHS